MTSAPPFDAYLERLNVAAKEPSLAHLFELHRAHVDRVPYETMWIATGTSRTIDPADAIDAIARLGHGGYCFQLNGAFSTLLTHLGFRVTRHAGAVHGHDAPTADQLHNHLVLMVHDLPTADNPTGTWYVDAGLGDALREPLPLLAGTYEQDALTFSLATMDDPLFDWHLTHDIRGSFPGMSFQAAEAQLADFLPKHLELSTAPHSLFVNNLIVMRRHEQGASSLVNLLLTENQGDRDDDLDAPPRFRLIIDQAEWFDLVEHHFRRSLADLDAPSRDRLWQLLVARHISRTATQAGAADQPS